MAAYDLNAKGSGNEVHAIRVRGSLYIDVLKILAALAVVILHTNAIFWEGPSSPAWLSANLIETLLYWAAPMFFMISGATLLNYPLRMSTKKYVVKRIRKTVVPYCLWTVIAILFFTVGPYRVMRPDLSIREIVKAFVRPGASPYTLPVYWYFPALFLRLCLCSSNRYCQRLLQLVVSSSLIRILPALSVLATPFWPFLGTFSLRRRYPADGVECFICSASYLGEQNFSGHSLYRILLMGLFGHSRVT